MPDRRPRHEQRKQHLLRLICAKFARLFSEQPTTFSRIVLEGIDGFLRQVFWGAYDGLETGVVFVFDDLAECRDADLWNRLFAERFKYNLAITILVRTLLYFENLPQSRNAFITRVNSIVGDRRFFFDVRKFNSVFSALYSDLFAQLEDKDLAREFDVLFGDGTARRIKKIEKAFARSLHSPAEFPTERLRARTKGRGKPAKNANGEEKTTILAVDDDLEVLELIAEVLKNEGYDVSVATSMEAAEEHLKRKPANVVILDIFMPGKGGIGGIQAIRQHHPATRTIAISGGWGAATAAQSTEAAKKLGADAIMQKPFKMTNSRR